MAVPAVPRVFSKYEPGTRKSKILGNISLGDGYRRVGDSSWTSGGGFSYGGRRRG